MRAERKEVDFHSIPQFLQFLERLSFLNTYNSNTIDIGEKWSLLTLTRGKKLTI